MRRSDRPFKSLRLLLEVFGSRLGLRVLPYCSRRVIRALAMTAGWVGWALAGALRRVAMANVNIVFGPSLPPARQRALVRSAFQTMALACLDLFWFTYRRTERLQQYVRIDPSIDQHVLPLPVIGVTAHFGNWEIIAQALALRGLRHVAVAAPLANPAVDVLFNRMRTDAGMEIIPRQGAVRGLIRALKDKKAVALLLDQNTKPEEGGVFVDFFGLPVPMSVAAAVLACRMNVRIIPLFCRVDPEGVYTLYAQPAIPPVPAPDKIQADSVHQAVTQQIAHAFQQEIRARPEQWLWMYKRWKHQWPPGASAQFPFYSKPYAAPVS